MCYVKGNGEGNKGTGVWGEYMEGVDRGIYL